MIMETLTYPNAGSLPALFSDRCLILKVVFRKEERNTIAIFCQTATERVKPDVVAYAYNLRSQEAEEVKEVFKVILCT